MGRFIDATADTTNRASASEVRCGAALASLLPAKYVVVLQPPSGHRAAVGGSGATADFIVYTGGADKSLQDIRQDESYWGTVDAYTPESSNGDAAAKMVLDKLSTQASAVIVDLTNIGNDQKREGVVTKTIAAVDKKSPKSMVVFHYNGASRVHNPAAKFWRDTEGAFV